MGNQIPFQPERAEPDGDRGQMEGTYDQGSITEILIQLLILLLLGSRSPRRRSLNCGYCLKRTASLSMRYGHIQFGESKLLKLHGVSEYVYIGVWVDAHVQARGQSLALFLGRYLPCFLRPSTLVCPGLTDQAGWQANPRVLPVSASPALGLQVGAITLAF